MEKEHSLYMLGRGGETTNQVNLVIVGFYFFRTLDKEKFRELLVDATEELLRRYNEDEKIRLYLKNYPFTVEDCVVCIYLKDKDGQLLKMLCVLT